MTTVRKYAGLHCTHCRAKDVMIVSFTANNPYYAAEVCIKCLIKGVEAIQGPAKEDA